jgi:5-methylcytosine-specific restriction endonuclease McrA
MMSMRTLVLNAGFEPLAVVSFKRALVLVMNDKASILSADDEHPVFTVYGAYDRPSVILLTRYVRMPNGRSIPVSRRGVLRRDGSRCAYCGGSASTIDHVLPRSRGGKDTWNNLVLACTKCNVRKGNRLPDEANMPLLRQPGIPRWLPRLGVRIPQDELMSWQRFIDTSYWDAELEDWG